MRQADKDYIARLHPRVRDAATRALEAATIALTGSVKPIITFTLRTWAEQQALYDQGRTKPGQIVTNAAAGQSYHNYGLALDFALQGPDFKLVWDINKDFDNDHVADWMEVVTCFKTEGFSWGGDWKGGFKDYPHLEMSLGYNWGQLSAMYTAKKFIPGTSYVNI